jgi:GntR family transcriptional regulator/MocR family aminotransferase
MFILNSNEAAPLFKQLYLQVREHVLSGRLSAHSKMPSVRDLARELAISRNTVEGAYQELYAEGYIYSKPRCGYFVSAIEQGAVQTPARHKAPTKARAPDLPSRIYDFHPARLDPQSFPEKIWRKCFLDCLREGFRDFTQYSEPQGDWGLRCNIQKYLEQSRGVSCEPEQIVICAGLQHSLEITAQLLKSSHSRVAVENPGYQLPRAVFRNHSYQVVPVPVASDGLDLEALTKSASTVVYVTPSHQLPMGYVMPVANRLKLIDWADAGGNFIIEDDYDSELRYQGKPIPSLQGLRPAANIVYLGTFSKILSPALRLSYLVLPQSLLPGYRATFGDYFSAVSLLEQRTLARFIELGHWERHVRRMRIVYKNKHDSLVRSVQEHFGSKAEIVGQGAGLHVVLRLLADKPDESEIVSRAQGNGIGLFPFSVTRATDEPDSVKLLLGFGGMTAGEIERGVALLAKICAD